MSKTQKNSFKNLINSNKPVLVDFSAEWCGPCKMLHPILVEVSRKVGDEAKIVKIDIDKNQDLASQLGVMSVPTLMLYKKGKLLWRESGVKTADQLEKLIKEAI
jgi:thioredoxin 1